MDDVDDLCDDVLSEEDIRELDQIVNGFFDQEIEERGTEEEVDLREVLENLSFEEDLSKPPETFNFLSFISALKTLASLQSKRIRLHIAKTFLGERSATSENLRIFPPVPDFRNFGSRLPTSRPRIKNSKWPPQNTKHAPQR